MWSDSGCRNHSFRFLVYIGQIARIQECTKKFSIHYGLWRKMCLYFFLFVCGAIAVDYPNRLKSDTNIHALCEISCIVFRIHESKTVYRGMHKNIPIHYTAYKGNSCWCILVYLDCTTHKKIYIFCYVQKHVAYRIIWISLIICLQGHTKEIGCVWDYGWQEMAGGSFHVIL